MSFSAVGYGTFEENRVVFIRIEPDKKLDNFRLQLSQTLKGYCNLEPYDYKRKFNYHATILKNHHKFEQTKKYIGSISKPNFKYVIMRVTLLKNRRILCEYDFFLERSLNRRNAKNSYTLSKTFNKLKEYLGTLQVKEINFDKGLINKIMKRRIFFISDTHFDHKNVIRYCNRPFKSVSEMNHTIVRNWNNTIRRGDVVFFLGDMCLGRRKINYWMRKLNGKIFFIQGNHDRINVKKKNVYNSIILNYKGEKFFITHEPENVPSSWNEWSICGHHHNNKALIDKKNKKMNVSVEMIGYKPILIENLIKLRN